ncbi:MAG: hypothetical protein U1F54_09090 [Burkholderiales bacterium]
MARVDPLVTFSVIADCVLLIFIARDWRVSGRVHPVYLWAGGALVLVHALELAADGSGVLIRLGRWLLGGSAG